MLVNIVTHNCSLSPIRYEINKCTRLCVIRIQRVFLSILRYTTYDSIDHDLLSCDTLKASIYQFLDGDYDIWLSYVNRRPAEFLFRVGIL
jgi:hypothetical protein